MALLRFLCSSGSLNDLNILDKSATVRSILDGSSPPRMEYNNNGNNCSLLYLLADSIYPSYPIFVKILEAGGNSRTEKCFSSSQAAVTKELENLLVF